MVIKEEAREQTGWTTAEIAVEAELRLDSFQVALKLGGPNEGLDGG